jgi:hypothetical protein
MFLYILKVFISKVLNTCQGKCESGHNFEVDPVFLDTGLGG